MNRAPKSILVVSPENSVAEAIGVALKGDANVRIDTETSTLAQMNGAAVKMAADYDIILFETSPDDVADMEAIRLLVAGRSPGTTLLALADANISLAQARALNHAGVDEVLPISLIEQEIGGQILRLDQLAAVAATPAVKNAGKIIAVAQARGGVGSTTVAVNLADHLAGPVRKSRRTRDPKVALVDFDLQFGTVGSFLDLDDQETLMQLALDGTVPDATFLNQCMVTMPNGLSVLAAPSKFAPLDSLRVDQVAGILECLQASHDYVVVDLPRALVGWIEAIVQRADQLVVVTDISVSSVRHCRRLIDFFTDDNVTLPVRIVVNHQKKPFMQSAVHREAAKALKRKLDYWLPHDPKAANAASDRGKPLSTAAPRSSLSKAVAYLAKDTQTQFQAAPSASKNKEASGV